MGGLPEPCDLRGCMPLLRFRYARHFPPTLMQKNCRLISSLCKPSSRIPGGIDSLAFFKAGCYTVLVMIPCQNDTQKSKFETEVRLAMPDLAGQVIAEAQKHK